MAGHSSRSARAKPGPLDFKGDMCTALQCTHIRHVSLTVVIVLAPTWQALLSATMPVPSPLGRDWLGR